jgi:LPXTG-motif cell wall-anchored protein
MLAITLVAQRASADVAPDGPDGLELAAPIVGLLLLVGAIWFIVNRRKKQ